MSESLPPDMDDLRLGKDLFSFLLDNIPDQVYFKDRLGRFLRVSRAVGNFLGVENPSDLIGKTDFDFWSPETAQTAFEDEQLVIESGEPLVGKVERLVYPDGRVRWDYTTKMPLRDSHGEIIGICGINKDFTAIMEMEDALREERNRLRITTAALEARNAQIEADLQMARVVQEALLPHESELTINTRANGHPALSIAHYYRPAAAVGGDIFHIFPLSRNRAGIFICDVMGHGVRAALVTAIIRACLDQLRPAICDPGQFLGALNLRLRTILKQVEEPLLATAFYMVADPGTKEVRFSNAGHPAPVFLHRRGGVIDRLTEEGRRPGCALGLFDGAAFNTGSSRFDERDRIVLFTDGLYEVDSPQGEEFGMTSLLESFQKHEDLPAQELFAAVLADVSGFCQKLDFDDDVCIVAVEQREDFK